MCDWPWCTCEKYDDVEAERDRLRELLSWAIGWVDYSRVAPTVEVDGEQDRAMYDRAHEAIQ